MITPVLLSLLLAQPPPGDPPVALIRMSNNTKSNMVALVNGTKVVLKAGEVRVLGVPAGDYDISAKGHPDMKWKATSGKVMSCDFGDIKARPPRARPPENKLPENKLPPIKVVEDKQPIIDPKKGLVFIDRPKGSTLLVDGRKIEGDDKYLFTPDLQPDTNYQYTVVCEVQRDGSTYRDERIVYVRAGRLTKVKLRP